MTDQASLRAAILDAKAPVPHGLTDGDGKPTQRRFSVYRNNVAVSLIDALEAAFPVTTRLLGQEFFRAMAGIFVRTSPPRSPLLMLYGSDFPAFLRSFVPVAHLPYLPDVARLEQALRESYHAADATPVDPHRLSLPPDELAHARVRFAPAVQLIRSPYPICAIWHANMARAPRPSPGAEDALVMRLALDPSVTVLPVGGDVLAALLGGASIGEAAAAEGEETLAPLFSALLAGGAIIDIEKGGLQ